MASLIPLAMEYGAAALPYLGVAAMQAAPVALGYAANAAGNMAKWNAMNNTYDATVTVATDIGKDTLGVFGQTLGAAGAAAGTVAGKVIAPTVVFSDTSMNEANKAAGLVKGAVETLGGVAIDHAVNYGTDKAPDWQETAIKVAVGVGLGLAGTAYVAFAPEVALALAAQAAIPVVISYAKAKIDANYAAKPEPKKEAPAPKSETIEDLEAKIALLKKQKELDALEVAELVSDFTKIDGKPAAPIDATSIIPAGSPVADQAAQTEAKNPNTVD